MAKQKVLNEKKEAKRKSGERKVNNKVQKIRKQKKNPLPPEEIDNIRAELLKELREKYVTTKGYDYLNEDELIILDGVLRGKHKLDIAKEVNMTLGGVYYKISTPHFQRAFQAEMNIKYGIMKKARKAMYVRIAEASLNILLTHLETIQKQQEKHGYSMEKIRDVMAIADKVISMMQEEDGTKVQNVNMSGSVDSVNVNLNGEMDSETAKKFDLADKEFRKHMAEVLIVTQPKTPML